MSKTRPALLVRWVYFEMRMICEAMVAKAASKSLALAEKTYLPTGWLVLLA